MEYIQDQFPFTYKIEHARFGNNDTNKFEMCALVVGLCVSIKKSQKNKTLKLCSCYHFFSFPLPRSFPVQNCHKWMRNNKKDAIWWLLLIFYGVNPRLSTVRAEIRQGSTNQTTSSRPDTSPNTKKTRPRKTKTQRPPRRAVEFLPLGEEAITSR